MLDCMAAGPLLVSDKDRQGLSVAQWSADARGENFVYGQC